MSTSSHTLEVFSTTNSEPQGLKIWLSNFLQRMKVNDPMEAIPSEEEDELDPPSMYLKNQVIIPLYLIRLCPEFHAIAPHHKAEMHAKATQDCKWTETGTVNGFNLASAVFPTQKWTISYQLEDVTHAILKRTWFLEHPECKRYGEGRMPDIAEEDDTTSTTSTTEDEETTTCPTMPVQLGSTPIEICYNQQILHKFIVQRYLKETTNLPYIPEIHSIHPWIGPGPEIINRQQRLPSIEELSYIIEDSIDGVEIKVEQNPQKSGSDRIYYKGKDGGWKRLSGRGKERFLDDLARIQVSYSFVTFEHLGILALKQCSMDEEKSSRIPVLRLDDRLGTVKVDIELSSPASKPDDISSKISTTSTLTETDNLPGPYPLQPIPSWEKILINPKTGNITHLGNSENAKTVLWEEAALPPLRLSKKARERWIYSLKRHWFGCYVRNRQGGEKVETMPRLDQLCKWKH